MEITYTYEPIKDAGQQFITKRGEIETLVIQTRVLMNGYQGIVFGIRAKQLFIEWETMQSDLEKAITILQTAGDFLNHIYSDINKIYEM